MLENSDDEKLREMRGTFEKQSKQIKMLHDLIEDLRSSKKGAIKAMRTRLCKLTRGKSKKRAREGVEC